ncbi:MAG: hypothetical protein A2725_03000 [Candidatus Magasanikbacteria bacterium RIFCSPHIGHO2_01_FULL_33_34]|uniref:FtsK domain-containing protein n=1 Tax=Candidatus Magasanikbacteria bacterium RIFCSPHIGHO2_01_FULL_33_34 TaxID=1798671 RepID=A0A1F6LH12_9BACT|nr:MAG: hypothetical protein A2725_03000 [Candidatus Magasanikbacteria bacterium RIFCSPHIGHO2_01_FULL_33_34]OGH66100.1 MAG: hypothetical protein A3B83_00490 [Candidatus Magasanikbacteria bacterium RIFCSPHIGHO2_02_FULL_33_17]OGH75946.1 MAG: hypothetical protein A3A89_00400 [Candidatus Magasanikbacteria bacterium RIFCSPLOWO2_01_FULL_33_34]OGH80944.1 MAG: hypothetical protein A3F93_02410 [Candidatus Magasanikbacteria bacterium RIFCSPLOWO2_12_FULL_34_7]
MSRKRKQTQFDPALSKGILSVILLVLSIIIILSFFDQAGPLGYILNKGILSFLFGSIRYASPFVILTIAWFLIKDKDYNYKPTHGIGAVLFFLSMSGLFHLSFPAQDMWAHSVLGQGGGVFGMTAWPIKTYLGSIAAFVILIGMTVVSLLLMFNTLIVHLLVINKKIFSSFGTVGKNTIKIINDLSKKDKTMPDEINDDTYEDTEDENEDDEDIGRLKLTSKKLNDPDEEEDENNEENKKIVHDNLLNIDFEKKENNLANKAWPQKTIFKPIPSLNLLTSKKTKPTSGDIKSNAEVIRETLKEFGIEVDMGEASVGPTVTRYTLKPKSGVKLSRIIALSNDLSLALAAHPIRIEAPIPGQSLVGIEVPNEKTATITFKELFESEECKNRKHNMMIALGKDVAGKVWFADLPRMPHLLIAGSTGSGKTVCVNTILTSLLYQNTAETLRIIMVDPKRVELTMYNGIPHLLTPVITNTADTIKALKWTIGEMERRFEVLSQDKSRDLDSFNSKHPNDKIPHIVFVVDELADLMATAAGEMEASIIRLAQMARAVGIHLVLATQRPSVDVITGLMKANIPGRIAFSLPSLIDSRTILDTSGAEKLLGRGDMLYLNNELSKPVRIQGAFLSENDLKNVVEYLQKGIEFEYDESILSHGDTNNPINVFNGSEDDNDKFFEESKRLVVQTGKASASFLQRKLKIGYSRAARILDQLEEAGVIGAAEGSKPREVLITESELDAETHIAMTEAMHGKKSITYDYQETEDNQTNESDENEEENDDEIIKEDEQSITHKVVTFDDNEYDEEEYENDNIEKNN